jgi:hypothetical protein
MNHMLFHFNDQARKAFGYGGCAQAVQGQLFAAQASAGGRNYRPGFDLSMGLLPTVRFVEQVQATKVQQLEQDARPRQTLLSFRGVPNTKYREYLMQAIFGDSNYGAVKGSVRGMVVDSGETLGELYTYSQAHHLVIEDGRMATQIDGQKSKGYAELLLSSMFSLCPEGEGRATYRVAESLRLGAIPVIVANRGAIDSKWQHAIGYDLPFEELLRAEAAEAGVEPIEWCVFFNESYPEHEGPPLGVVVERLERLTQESPETLDAMRKAGRSVYDRFYKSTDALMRGVLDALASRVKQRLQNSGEVTEPAMRKEVGLSTPPPSPIGHSCDNGAHACDKSSTRCTKLDVDAYACECLEGFRKSLGDTLRCVARKRPSNTEIDGAALFGSREGEVHVLRSTVGWLHDEGDGDAGGDIED